MSILHVTKIECKCERCGHEWCPVLQTPTVCPKCKSPYWNHPKKEKKLKIIKAQGPKAQGPKAQGPKAQGPKAQGVGPRQGSIMFPVGSLTWGERMNINTPEAMKLRDEMIAARRAFDLIFEEPLKSGSSFFT